MEAQKKERDIIRVHDFLFGLDDTTHDPVRSQICAQIPIPDLDTVYLTIVQNETVQINSHKEPPACLASQLKHQCIQLHLQPLDNRTRAMTALDKETQTTMVLDLDMSIQTQTLLAPLVAVLVIEQQDVF